MRDLSAAMGELGWPLAASAISQIENLSRRVDVDDLMALSVALDTSPNTLLMPEVKHPSDIVDGGPLGTRTEASHVWYWLLLPPRPGDPLNDWPRSPQDAEAMRRMTEAGGPKALVAAIFAIAEQLRDSGEETVEEKRDGDD